MTFCKLALGLTTLAALAQPASALTFNVTTIPGDSLTISQAAAFSTAAAVWSASLSDAITVNLQIGFTRLGTNVLAETSPTVVYRPGGVVRNLLAADAKDATDAMAVASLSMGTDANLLLTSAEAKAIGALAADGTASDGSIQFSTDFTFSTARNPDGTIPAGTYDLIGIAEHEIGHMLGFVSGIDFGTTTRSVLDEFRYASTGVRSYASGASAYFSIDGGRTHLAGFTTGSENQASHWAIGTSGVMVPEAGSGQVQNITALDLLALDTIGYDLVSVPEPWSLALLAVGAVGAVGSRRRA